MGPFEVWIAIVCVGAATISESHCAELAQPIISGDILAYDAEEQYKLATKISYCTGYSTWPLTLTETEDVQHVLEFASAQSLKPSALLSMVRRLSAFADACQTGVRYLDPASGFTAKEAADRPRSLVHRPPIAPKAGQEIGTNPKLSDPSHVARNPLADVATEFSAPRTHQPAHLAQPAAQRFFVGGDRFPQSYSRAVQLWEVSAARARSSEAIAMLGYAHAFGLGAEKDLIAGRRLLHIAAHAQDNSAAAAYLGEQLIDFAATPSGRLMNAKVAHEARNVLGKASDRGVPIASQELVAWDLLMGDAIRMKWLMTLSGALSRGLPVATHMVAKLTANEFMGFRTCPQAWSLMAKLVRRDLWYSGVVTSIRDMEKTVLSDELLIELAHAGVEPAEWALALRSAPYTPATESLRWRYLGYSAHRGRASAQLQIVKESYRLPHASKSGKTEAAGATEDPLDLILDAWGVKAEDRDHFRHTISPEQAARENALLLVSQRQRWLTFDEEGSEVAIASAEAITHLSLMSFIGYATEQNLRDSLVWIGSLPSIAPAYWKIEVIYYVIIQSLFTANKILLTLGWKEQAALIVMSMSILGGVVMTTKRRT